VLSSTNAAGSNDLTSLPKHRNIIKSNYQHIAILEVNSNNYLSTKLSKFEIKWWTFTKVGKWILWVKPQTLSNTHIDPALGSCVGTYANTEP
jgi:hypothetical protein